jgi:hypothetical protein
MFDSHGLMELCDLAKRTYSLDSDDNLLLLHFATHPVSSAYDIVSRSSMPSGKSSSNIRDTSLQQFFDNMYKETKKGIRNLVELKLIEEVTVDPNPRKAHFYQLTIHGVYYLITTLSWPPRLVRNLLIGYGDHPLFRFFIYPWLSQKSLLNLNSDSLSLFSQIFLYLRDCCMIINDTLDYLNWLEDLFIWEEVRNGSEDAKALSNFLAQEIGGYWPNRVDVQKSDKTLEIRRHKARSVLIRLSNDRKSAIVYYKNKKEIKLQVRKSFNQTVIQRPRQLDENYMKNFAESHRVIVQRFIISIILDESLEPETTGILVGDKTFLKAIQDTKRRFKKRCDHFLTR